jgi:hypothetical protein
VKTFPVKRLKATIPIPPVVIPLDSGRRKKDGHGIVGRRSRGGNMPRDSRGKSQPREVSEEEAVQLGDLEARKTKEEK